MRLITVNSQSIYLLDDPVDWSTPFKAKARLKANVETGLTNREGRRALAASLMFRLSSNVQAVGMAARVLRAALRAYQNEPVAVPLWPAACRWADRASAEFTGGLNYVFKADGSQSEVYETEPGWPAADDKIVPLVVGYFDGRELTMDTDDLVKFAFALEEDSPPEWAVSPVAYTAPAGPKPDAYAVAPRLFPFPTNWDQPRTTLTLRIDREQIGFGREQSAVARAAAVARTVEQTAWASRVEGFTAGQLLRFFADHGAGKSFWTSGAGRVGSLHANLPANASGLLFEGAEPYLTGDYIAFLQGGRLVLGVGPIANTGAADFSKLVTDTNAMIIWSDGSGALAQ